MVELLFATFSLNLIFGYWRYNATKFSLKWFLAIHLPIPFVYLLRNYEGIGIWILPILLVIAITGQILGGIIRSNIKEGHATDTGGATQSK